MNRFHTLCMCAAIALIENGASGFAQRRLGRAIAPSAVLTTARPTTAALYMLDLSGISETSSALTSVVSSSGVILAETEPWIQPFSQVLGPFLNFLSFAMLCRVVASWYPKTNLNETPWNIIAWPTEPLLKIMRGSIPPAFGVDITPVFWVGVFTFLNEILLGQQGLLTMKIKYGM